MKKTMEIKVNEKTQSQKCKYFINKYSRTDYKTVEQHRCFATYEEAKAEFDGIVADGVWEIDEMLPDGTIKMLSLKTIMK